MRSNAWRSHGVPLVAAGLAILSATVVFAQERPRALERAAQRVEQRITADRAQTHTSAADQQIAQCLAIGNAVVPSPHPRSSTRIPAVMPRRPTSVSPLSRMLAAIRVKSPFSQSA